MSSRLLPLLLASYALSPKLGVLRLDDLVVAALVILAPWRRLVRHAVDLPLACWLLGGALSLLAGAWQGLLGGWMPVLTLLKQMEYLIGFLAARALSGSWDLPRLSRFCRNLAVAVALAGLGERALLLHAGAAYIRVFSNPLFPYQTNHMAGFLALGATLGLGLFPAGRGPRLRWTALQIILGLGLLNTGSRGGLLAALVGGLCFAVFHGRGRALLWTGLLLAGGIAFTAPLREGFFKEYHRYAQSEALAELGYPRLGDLERNRFEVWTALREDVLRHPVLGSGPGSRNRVFYESQAMMTLAETGVVGLALTAWVLLTLARSAAQRRRDPLMWALMGVLAGVLAQGGVAETLVITRIAGPFWLLWGAARW